MYRHRSKPVFVIPGRVLQVPDFPSPDERREANRLTCRGLGSRQHKTKPKYTYKYKYKYKYKHARDSSSTCNCKPVGIRLHVHVPSLKTNPTTS